MSSVEYFCFSLIMVAMFVNGALFVSAWRYNRMLKKLVCEGVKLLAKNEKLKPQVDKVMDIYDEISEVAARHGVIIERGDHINLSLQKVLHLLQKLEEGDK